MSDTKKYYQKRPAPSPGLNAISGEQERIFELPASAIPPRGASVADASASVYDWRPVAIPETSSGLTSAASTPAAPSAVTAPVVPPAAPVIAPEPTATLATPTATSTTSTTTGGIV